MQIYIKSLKTDLKVTIFLKYQQKFASHLCLFHFPAVRAKGIFKEQQESSRTSAFWLPAEFKVQSEDILTRNQRGRAAARDSAADFRWASDPARTIAGRLQNGTQSSWRYYLLQHDKPKCLQWDSERARGEWMTTLTQRQHKREWGHHLR